MAAKKITHFEACIGNQWLAWDADSVLKIVLSGNTVTIDKGVQKDDKTFVLKTVVDLTQVPAYALY